jgi:hypothetical protein
MKDFRNSWDVFVKALTLWWGDWANQVLVSLSAVLLSLTVVLAVPAYVGVLEQARDLTHGVRTGIGGMWLGFRRSCGAACLGLAEPGSCGGDWLYALVLRQQQLCVYAALVVLITSLPSCTSSGSISRSVLFAAGEKRISWLEKWLGADADKAVAYVGHRAAWRRAQFRFCAFFYSFGAGLAGVDCAAGPDGRSENAGKRLGNEPVRGGRE